MMWGMEMLAGLQFTDQKEDRPIPHPPHGPELETAREDLARLAKEGREHAARAESAKRAALDLIANLTAFKRAEPKLARKKFATRKGWKAHRRAFRGEYRRAIREAVSEANRAATREALAIGRLATELHRPEHEAAIAATRKRRK